MIQLADNKTCTGCSACVNICPKQAIDMFPDNEGFLQPVINTDKCIECELCMKTCPLLQKELTVNTSPLSVFACISNVYQRNGSSGGAFSAIAKYVLDNKGVVLGAAFDSDMKLRHISVDKEQNMQPLRGSKYLQSMIGNSYKQVKELLRQNRLVLFSGTPCQIAGLNSFLKNKRYDNLITVDLTCHGVPSQKAFDRWMQDVEKKYDKVIDLKFRKLDGWSIVPRVALANHKHVSLRYDLEAYMWAFYEGFLFRKCCYDCKFATVNRPADITLADFWGIGNYGVEFKPNQTHGVSLVLANDEKGKNVLSQLKDVYLEKRTLDEALHEQHNLKEPSARPSGRETSALDFVSDMPLLDFAAKYGLLPRNKAKYLFMSKIKDCLIDWGAFDVLKNMINKLTN